MARRWGSARHRFVAAGIAGLTLLALGVVARPAPARATLSQFTVAQRHLKHLIFIVQENRSFDEYFGTYPGANGILDTTGHLKPGTCIPNVVLQKEEGNNTACSSPKHVLPADTDQGGDGPHDSFAANHDVDGGKMDWFVNSMYQTQPQGSEKGKCEEDFNDPACKKLAAAPPVMGYLDQSNIANYWAYAHHFALQDHLFEPTLGWSLPSHLFFVSGWSALCPDAIHPMKCQPNDGLGKYGADKTHSCCPFAWTDLTWLLHHHMSGGKPDPITWVSYVGGDTPDMWNVLPQFTDVKQDDQTGNTKQLNTNPTSSSYLEPFKSVAAAGKLPAVTWVFPPYPLSEHPPNGPCVGQSFVTSVVNTLMRSPDWNTSAIFVTWDDWGGFYDHVVPPTVDGLGYGLRVPGLIISPWVKQAGLIDHHIESFDAYLKLAEDLFLNSQRLDPHEPSRMDGRPDSRPDVRENLVPGDLLSDFSFKSPPGPLPKVFLNPKPAPCQNAQPLPFTGAPDYASES